MTASGDGLSKASQLAKAARDLYPELKRTCAEQAVRWEWGTFTLHSLEPAYFEVHKFRRGDVLDAKPDETLSGACGHGFDAAGRLVVEHELTEFAGRFSETFYRWEPTGIASLYFDYDPGKRWISAAWLSRDDGGRIQSIDTVYARGNSLSETFRYDAQGRVIGVERKERDPAGADSFEYRDIEYDAADRIVRVYWRYPDGRRVLDFERPPPERTFAALEEELGDRLLNAIVASLERLSPGAPIFALAIQSCDAEYQDRLPPDVAIGLESERAQFVEEHGRDAADWVWNPAEWTNQLTLDLDEETSSKCESVNQDIWQNELQEQADSFMTRLARRVAEHPSLGPRTDDFVSYVVNHDEQEPKEAVAAQIDERIAKRLRLRGLL